MTAKFEKVRQNLLEEKEKQHESKSGKRYAISLFILILLYIVSSRCLWGIVTVTGSSMYPAIRDKDILIFGRLDRNFEYGDMVVVKNKQADYYYVKRVIGVAGDEIDIREGSVYRNGIRLEEDYLVQTTLPGEMNFPVVLSQEEVFLLGDNRKISKDSRSNEIGLVRISDMVGKVKFQFRSV